jgi:hypothetical protein
MKRSKNQSNYKNRPTKQVYEVKGESLDQETIVRLRPQIEDYVKVDLNKKFRRTELHWDMRPNTHFDFTIKFYA